MEIKKNNKTYEFDVIAKLTSAPGGLSNFYFSKLQYLLVEDDKSRERLNIEFGESRGDTAEEANEKMRKIIKDWIEKNG